MDIITYVMVALLAFFGIYIPLKMFFIAGKLKNMPQVGKCAPHLEDHIMGGVHITHGMVMDKETYRVIPDSRDSSTYIKSIFN